MTSESRKSGHYLAIDGGFSGLPALFTIREIFGRLKHDLRLEEQEELLPCQWFDTIIGTGHGGIVALLFGRLQMSPNKAIDAYSKLSKAIPTTPVSSQEFSQEEKMRNMKQFKEEFTKLLESVGLSANSPMQIRDGTKSRTIICTINECGVGINNCQLIRSYPSRSQLMSTNCTILDAACASIASPDIFPAVTLGQEFNVLKLIDGMMGYANPTKEMLMELRNISAHDLELSSIVSIGAGMRFPTEREYSVTIKQIITNTEEVHQDLQRRTQDLGIYFRLNHHHGFLPNSTPNEIVQATIDYLRDVTADVKINRIVSLLKDSEQMPAESMSRRSKISINGLLSVSGGQTSSKPRPALAQNFVGREDVLSKLQEAHLGSALHERRQGPVISVISGLGGSGKTQIALKFALEFEKIPGSYIFFLDATSEDKLQADLRDVLRASGTPMVGQSWEDAIRWIARLKNWMVVFDNADNPSFPIGRYFPKNSFGHIIITTQNSTIGLLSPQNHHPIEGLVPENAISLLLVASLYEFTESNVAAARGIVAELGCLPLAVSHAAGYIYVNRCLNTYLELYRQNQLSILAQSPSTHEQNRTVAATIQLSFTDLPERSRHLLRIMAHLQVTSIAISIFCAGAMHQFKRRSISGRSQTSFLQESSTLISILCPSGTWSEFEFDTLIKPCLEHSLLRITAGSDGTKFYSMHILVQTWLLAQKEHIDGTTPECLATRLLVSAITFGEWQKNLTPMQRLIPHVKLVPSVEEVRDPGAHGDFARVLHQAGDYTSALVQIDYAVKGWEAKLGDVHDQTLSSMQSKANLLDLAGRVQESLDLGQRILRIRQQHYPEKHPSTLICMSAVAQAMTMCGKNQEAATIAERALVLQQEAFGENNAETLMTMTRLGWIYDNLRRYTEALTIKERALRISQEQHGESHIITLKSMGAVGVTLTKLGKFQRAYELQSKIVDIRTKMLGPEHPDTLSSLGNISSTLIDMGRKDEAIPQCKRVVEARTKLFGRDHPQTLRALYYLLFAYDKFREDEEKSKILLEILDLHERVLGPDHRHTRQIIKWQRSPAKGIRG